MIPQNYKATKDQEEAKTTQTENNNIKTKQIKLMIDYF